jgi:ATP-dependent DNA helicase DinG
MARAVASAFSADESLLCEAGTGVGKSLAYLLPGIIHAIDTARQLVVSTHTIPLQEQIQNNDLDKCRRLFESESRLNRYAGFKTALLVGKANYLCTTRLAKAIQQHTELLETTQQTELRRIQEWSQGTQTGLREELGGNISSDVWDWVNADSSVCSPRNCNPEICPYQKARARIGDANVIIVNHALLLSLIAAGASPRANVRGVLYPSDFVVLDEAHCIPEVATSHFGSTVTAYSLERQLKMLWNPKRNRGLLGTYGKQNDSRLVVEALMASEFFFNEIRQLYLDKHTILRLRKPGWIEPRLNLPLQLLIERLQKLSEFETDRNRKSELDDFRRRIAAIHGTLNDAINIADVPDSVYWLEKTGIRGQNISINSAPLDVSRLLNEKVFDRKTSVVMTSATLSNGIDMERFKKQCGAEDVAELIEHSPFDYRRNLEIYAATDAPVPDQRNNGARDSAWLSAVVEFCVRAVPGGTLVLCTSHGDVKKISAHLETTLHRERPVFAQLAGTSRSDLVRRFTAADNAVLIGTDSFWTGIDVPGPALSQVIIVRLPFDNPSHPIVEAKAEWLEQQSLSPFFEMTVPDAVIQFRQGIGRLIRKMDDRGRLIVLDSRILTKTYGKQFVAALPHDHIIRFTRTTLAEKILPYR